MKSTLQKLPMLLVLLYSILNILLWWFDQQALLIINPNFIFMVFNSALCFAVASGMLLLPESKIHWQKTLYLAGGLFLILFSGAILAQDLAGADIGIDTFFSKASVSDLNPHSGRMAPQTAICFILCGFTFIGLCYLTSRLAHVLIQCAMLFVFALSMIGLAGGWLKLEALYPWYKYSRMAITVAFSFIVLSIILWLAWYKAARQDSYLKDEEKRIGVTGIALIIGVTFTAGMSVFGILSTQMERTLETSLMESYINQSHIIENEISQGINSLSPITTRILINRYLSSLNSANGNDSGARRIVAEDAESFLSDTISAVGIYNVNGAPVAEAGHFVDNPELNVPLLNQRYPAQLLWKNGPLLRVHMEIAPEGTKIGSAMVDLHIPDMAVVLSKENLIGKTAETGICAAMSDSQMDCLPLIHRPKVALNSPRSHDGISFPIDHAFKGEKGIFKALDYRSHQVIAAVGMVGNLGLGMVVKLDAAEFYDPVREKLQYTLVFMLLLSAIAIWVQRLQLIPLVGRLVRSEHEAQLVKQALEESSRLNNAILLSAAYLIVATDSKGTIIVFNKQAEQALGYSAQELVGKHTPAIFHDADEIIQRAAELSLEYGELIQPGFEVFTKKTLLDGSEKREWTFIHKDGSRFSGELIASVLKDSQQQAVGFLGIIQDISERKQVERIKSEFIATVSHELRTPLTSIRGSLGLLLGGVAGKLENKNKSLIEIAYKNCERLVTLINDILDIEKIESGQMQFDMKIENIADIIEQALVLNRAYGEKYNIRFLVVPPVHQAMVRVDSNRLLQVMANLMSNAAKFSESGSDVDIFTEKNDNFIRINIRDHGLGIPAEFKTRIFQKFAQADSSDSRKKGGTGLGLSIARNIIEHMNGSMGFSSQPGEGTVFYFDLPIIQQPLLVNEKSPEEHVSLRPRVLICEDDHDIAHLLGMTLDVAGFDIDIAYSAGMAMDFIHSNPPYAAMTLDLMLPDKDGITFLGELREREATRILPVIIVSANAELVSGKLQSLAVGIIDCLKKPIDIERLVRAVRSLVTVSEKPHILHVEDDEDIVNVLAISVKDIAVVTRAKNIVEARKMLREQAFDLVILDLGLPDGSGLEILQLLKQSASPIPVIIFSGDEVSNEVSSRVAASLVKSRSSGDNIVSVIKNLISKVKKPGPFSGKE